MSEEQSLSTENVSEKNAWLYAVLLWFFGYLGIHKFYLNKTMWGVIYLLTGGLFTLGVIFDCIMLAFAEVRDQNEKVLTGAKSLKTVCLVMILLPIAFLLFLVFAFIPAVFTAPVL